MLRRNSSEPPRCVSSGSTLLDLALGGGIDGGWGIGRVSLLIGDKSSGKTLLAIEACANMALLSGPKHVRYAESEDAFDEAYGRAIGMPDGIGRSQPGEIATVEDFEKDLSNFLKGRDGGPPCLYVIDSLDGLSDEAEMKRGFGEDSFGTKKAKLMSEMFRRINSAVAIANCTLLIVLQTRDNIGVMFGARKRHSGGNALDFYASQIVWLREIGQIKRTVYSVDRITGIEVSASVRKNKLAVPFRTVPITVLFNYGSDDEAAMISWLKTAKSPIAAFHGYDLAKVPAAIAAARHQQDYKTMDKLHAALRTATADHWGNIEAALAPQISKYHRS